MFSVLSNWFNNSTVQSMLIGPLMGVFFAALFSGFDRSPSRNAPITVRETVREYTVIYLGEEPRRTVNGDPLSIGIAATMCLMFLAWEYVLYSETILSYLLMLILTTISFSLTTILVSVFKGHFNNDSWWFYTIFPLSQLLFCVYLLSLAWTAIDPKLIELARKSTPIHFYTRLTEQGSYFVVTQLLGVTLLFIVVLFSALDELYYLALMSQRGQGIFTRLWVLIVRLTWRISGTRTLTSIAGSIFLPIISFLLLAGYITSWIIKYL
jgi:hypothetical protein